DDFVEKLIGRLDAARPASSGPKAASKPAQPTIEATAIVESSGPIEPGVETAATVFDPLAAAKVAEAEAESRRGEDAAKTTHDTPPSAKDPRAPAGPTIEAAPAPVAVQPITLGGDPPNPPAQPASTRESRPAPSGVAATTQHDPVT